MERDVLISISGAQISDGDTEDVEMITIGDYFLKNGKHYVVYDEVEEDSKNVVKNTIKITKDSMDIIKMGNISTHMVFEKDKKNLACYLTPFGEMMIGIQTNDIRLEEQEDSLRVDVEYSLDINYEHVSDCNITVAVRPRRA